MASGIIHLSPQHTFIEGLLHASQWVREVDKEDKADPTPGPQRLMTLRQRFKKK